MIGLDTTAIIDIFKGEKKIIEKVNELKEPIVSTIINYQEIFFGIDAKNYSFTEEENYYDSFFNSLEVLELTKSAAKIASNVLWRLKKSGLEKEHFDCMIAGILLSSGVNKILTKNARHFDKIEGLKVISY